MLKAAANFLYELIESFAVSLVIFLVVYFFLAFPEEVFGASMEPTLATGDRLIVERLSVKFNRLGRGDVVILNPPGRDVDFVKRIVGLPGESLLILDCKVFLVKNDFEKIPLSEPFVNNGSCTKINDPAVIKLSENTYYVLGDNREHSADSRFFGPIEKKKIDGKVVFRFWPPSKLRTF